MKTKLSRSKSISNFINFSILIFVTTVCLISCNIKGENNPEQSNESLPEEKNIVETIVVQNQDFTREIVSNGKLLATQRAELWFKNPGIINEISATNGQAVSEGKIIAQLQDKDLRFAYNKAKLNMEQAEIDRLDALLSMGYKSMNENIPVEHMKIANIRSGYTQKAILLDEAQQALDDAILSAPFTGKIEGIKQKPFERANQADPFCTLINDEHFTIEFPLLETEFNQVKTGQKVIVSPIAVDNQTTGIITEINPKVDENGLVWVKAEINNPGGYIEGMNVKVSIKHSVPGQLVVPKQAVVLRQNREVLFRYTGGISYWTYINVIDENETQYAVVAAEGATLNPGDTVIISNNLNLAHESQVELE